MRTFPIPTAYVATGVGPGQIPVRGVNGEIPGVPTIFTRTLVDEVAEIIRRTVPSGFLTGGHVEGTPVGELHQVSFPAGAELIMDGYRVLLDDSQTALQLTLPPTTGSRDDLVFIELWFDYAGAHARQLRWRLRSIPGINFTAYPEGLGAPTVTAFDYRGLDTSVPYQRFHPNFKTTRDPGLYIAAVPHMLNDIVAEKGLDDQPYRLTYAMPLARIKRLNSAAYHATTNPQGAPPSSAGGVSPRPDGLFSDKIDADYQIQSLRNEVSFDHDWPQVFRVGVADMLQGRLVPHGAVEEIIAALNDNGQQGYFADPASTAPMVFSTNLVRYSHLAADTNTDDLADGWAAYQTGSTVGSLIFANPGQVIERTADDDLAHYGIQQVITGFSSDRYRTRFSYIVAWTNPNTKLVVQGIRSDLSVAFTQTTTLADKAVGVVLTSDFQVLNPQDVDTEITLRVYLVDGGGRITLNYVDVRPDLRDGAVQVTGDGSLFTFTRASGLLGVGTFTAGTVTVYNGVTGALATATVTAPSASTLTVQLPSIPTQRDFRVVVPVSYAAGTAGLGRSFTSLDKGWDIDGFAGLVHATDTTSPLTEQHLGLEIAAGDDLWVVNPTLGRAGTVLKLIIPGNGTGTYTLPATKYGRSLLMPLSATVNSAPQTLASVTRAPSGAMTFTLGSGATVLSTSEFELTVALAAPVVLWDERANGITGVYRTELARTTAATGTDTVVVPLTGVAVGPVEGTACLGVFVNGVGVTLAQGATITGLNTPALTVELPFIVNPGDLVEVAVLTRDTSRLGQGLSIAYPTTVSADNRDFWPEAVVLAGPLMLAHTKGTGAVNADSDYGTEPFLRDPLLDGRQIALAGYSTMGSMVSDIPLLANRLAGEPVYPGRKITLVQGGLGAGMPWVLEGPLLDQTCNHRTLVALLVKMRGRVCLAVADASRTDNRNLVDVNAPLRILDLNGRPITLA